MSKTTAPRTAHRRSATALHKRTATVHRKVAAGSKAPLRPSRRSWHHRLTGFTKAKPLVFVGIFAALGLAVAGFSGAATTAPSGLISNANGKCLDNYAQVTYDNNPVKLWTCNSTAGEQWTLTSDGTIRTQGKCLDVYQQGKTAGTRVVIYGCSSYRASQKWTIRADKSILNNASGLCLDNYGNSSADGNKINIWTCNGTAAQRWTVPVAASASSSSTPPATPPATTPPTASVLYPANVMDLSKWKLTLPVAGSNGDAQEIKQPQLATYSNSKFFFLNSAKTGVVFRTYFGGATTSGSSNPRTELREMTGSDGLTNASWSTTSGTHSMTVRGKVNHLTNVRPYVVIAQIHDASDDVTVFRLEGSSLYVTNGDTTHWNLVTDNFQLGVEHTWGFKVSGGKISYTFDGQTRAFTLAKSTSGCYFKAGNYLQSNPGNSSGESTSAYSEVELTSVQVSHS